MRKRENKQRKLRKSYQGGKRKASGQLICYLWLKWASLVAQIVKDLPAMQET